MPVMQIYALCFCRVGLGGKVLKRCRCPWEGGEAIFPVNTYGIQVVYLFLVFGELMLLKFAKHCL